MMSPLDRTHTDPPQTTEFRRDAPTVLAYSALVCFAFWNYGYGTVLTGLAFPAVARRVPRPRLMWGSAVLAVGGAALFVTGSTIPLTLAGAGILGLGGTMLLAVIQAVLSDGHGGRRDRALTEANIGAAACAVLAPLALGALAAGPLGWRAAFALPVIGLAALYVRYRSQPLPSAPAPAGTSSRGRLPAASSLLAGVAAASMGVEFCLVYFGAEQLRGTGLSTTAAVTAMSGHYLGLLMGRVGGAFATRRPGRAVLLMHVSLATTTVGFLLFWLTEVPAVAVLGLLLAGLGVANLYPLSVALSLEAAPDQEDQANSRSQLLGGLLVITAPYILGSLADGIGLTTAFAIEPVLIALCLVLLLAGLRARR